MGCLLRGCTDGLLVWEHLSWVAAEACVSQPASRRSCWRAARWLGEAQELSQLSSEAQVQGAALLGMRLALLILNLTTAAVPLAWSQSSGFMLPLLDLECCVCRILRAAALGTAVVARSRGPGWGL